LIGFGAGGGVVPPLTPEEGAGDNDSSRPGSSSRRDLGVFSTVEPPFDPLADRDGGVTDDDGGLSTSEGTEVTVPLLTGSSDVTVALELPQLVQGAATGAGLA
jgi:hypothetical protein